MKTTYKLSKNNKLTIVKGQIILHPKGYFKVDKDNRLIYEVKEPKDWRLENGIPERIVLEGKWGLDVNHNLVFTLRKTQTQSGYERLTFKSQLIQARANSLIFTFGTQGRAGTHAPRLLQLNGKWQADKHNRLQFLVKKLKSSSDTLTLQASWQVKKNNLIYTYKKTSLKTKTKQQHTLRFKGYWQINKKNQLTYILDTKSDSSFTFKTYLETPSIIGKKGAIKYRVGIGLKGSRLFKTEIITLYGVWKLHRKTGLSFEIDYGRINPVRSTKGTVGRSKTSNGVKAITFGAFVRLDKQSKATFKLKTRDGKDLGLSLEFSRTFLKNNAEWFLRVAREKKRPEFEWGVKIPW